ncbi:hypothetical protein FOMPIDRAFT_91923 [Fomitopsis schrenkii]|uniref:F-box domain-containing protein n=1 Tax=Fomitopsis schrenkii TaxID=2126942 RepID=S8EFB8_FOMSC|nr:hypothetical protein FOMPIDRAFT_91923 [Fomitopsis schrenkii]
MPLVLLQWTWLPAIEIIFSVPQYRGDRLPTFPHELTERILNFLWDEPLYIVQCSLVCRAWYHAARHHVSDVGSIRSNTTLRSLAHILVGKRMPRYGKIFFMLTISENASSLYVHTFPMLVPGSLCTNVRYLILTDIDWAAQVTPHRDFFTYLSFYASVQDLRLTRCCFRNIEQLYKLVDSVPSLASLGLDGVRLAPEAESDILAGRINGSFDCAPQRRTRLVEFSLSMDPNHLTARRMRHGLLSFAASSSSLVRLELDARYFPSLEMLESFLVVFPALGGLSLQHDPPWLTSSHLPNSQPSPGSCDAGARMQMRMPALRRLAVTTMHSASAAHLLVWVCTVWPCNNVEQPMVLIEDDPSSALQAIFTHVLYLAAATLKAISWRSLTTDFVPRYEDIATLETLDLRCTLHEVGARLTLSQISEKLFGLLSQCTGTPRLEHLLIQYPLSTDSGSLLTYLQHVESSHHVQDPGLVAEFHDLLTKGAFTQLPAGSVTLTAALDASSGAGDAPTLITSILNILFAPWLNSGVMSLFVDYSPFRVQDGHPFFNLSLSPP